MSSNRSLRAFVTFYSFKGGVGRSLALVNVAWRLARRHGLRVIVVDWDLEAPGLHHFLAVPSAELRDRPGVLDFCLAWSDAIAANATTPPDVRPGIMSISRTAVASGRGSLQLLHAGRTDPDYARRLADFDWRFFYEKREGWVGVEVLREQLSAVADLVLVDSRTGHADTSGICTMQLPDAVVLLSSFTEQSFDGVHEIARAIEASSFHPGRPTPTLWFALGRAPEGTRAAEALTHYRHHFDDGVAAGLWRTREHPAGPSSWQFPQEIRWATGEPLLTDGDGPLAAAFDRFAAKLFLWHLGGPEGLATATRSMDEAADALAQAHERDDEVGRCVALLHVGRAHIARGEALPALVALGRAIGIAESRRLVGLRNLCLEASAAALRAGGDTAEALRQLQRSLEPLEEPDVVSWSWRARVHHTVASMKHDARRWPEVEAALGMALEAAVKADDRTLERALHREHIELVAGGHLPVERLVVLAADTLVDRLDDGLGWTYDTALLLGRAWVKHHTSTTMDDALPRDDEGRVTDARFWFGVGAACAEAGVEPFVTEMILQAARWRLRADEDALWVERADAAIGALSPVDGA